jgi:hypothetical protein
MTATYPLNDPEFNHHRRDCSCPQCEGDPDSYIDCTEPERTKETEMTIEQYLEETGSNLTADEWLTSRAPYRTNPCCPTCRCYPCYCKETEMTIDCTENMSAPIDTEHYATHPEAYFCDGCNRSLDRCICSFLHAPVDFSDIDEITELDRQEMRETLEEYAQQRLYKAYLAGEASDYISFEEYKELRANEQLLGDEYQARNQAEANWLTGLTFEDTQF